MSDDSSDGNGFKSLTTQIREAELQVLEHQCKVFFCADRLVHRTHQHLIVPSNLLLAGGIGFVIGELTKRKSFDRKSVPAGESASITGILIDALNSLNTISALYTTFRASINQTETRASE